MKKYVKAKRGGDRSNGNENLEGKHVNCMHIRIVKRTNSLKLYV